MTDYVSVGAGEPPQANVDTLSISNLDLPNGILAPYVFGERKLQPATLSVDLVLDQGFSSAASGDALDQNTVHYGNLAKAIRECRPSGQTLRDLFTWTDDAVERLARRGDGSSRVRRVEVRVRLEKASAMGSAVEVVSVRSGEGGEARTGVKFEGVRVMVLVGVNAVERTAKQALDVDLEVWALGREEVLRRDVEAFGLEKAMVAVVEPTKFETLESLGEHVVRHLKPKVADALPSAYLLSLAMKKPKAIAFADAPVLSLTRLLEPSNKGTARGTGKLNLIKPYV